MPSIWKCEKMKEKVIDGHGRAEGVDPSDGQTRRSMCQTKAGARFDAA